MTKKILFTFALLCAFAQGAWAQANWDAVYATTNTTSSDWTAVTDADEVEFTLGIPGTTTYYYAACDLNFISWFGSGLTIKGTVYLYVPEGVTVTCTGKDSDGRGGAGAGIELASGNTLYLLGSGTVIATGGNASNGLDGDRGEDALLEHGVYSIDPTKCLPGNGADGGSGGGGAGAGIGTRGGDGGFRGAGAIANKEEDAGTNLGVDGNPGNPGNTAGSMGKLYVATSFVHLTATGGAAGSTGGNGGERGYNAAEEPFCQHDASGGGGGGGGGFGGAASNIGTGGSGGGGGGGGAAGNSAWRCGGGSFYYVGAGGGEGGTNADGTTADDGTTSLLTEANAAEYRYNLMTENNYHFFLPWEWEEGNEMHPGGAGGAKGDNTVAGTMNNIFTIDENGNYIIGNATDWDTFAAQVTNGNTNYSGKTVKLMADISVSTMVGADKACSFKGTFDGGGHTLTFTKGTASEPFDEEYCAPFRYIAGATIRDLRVEGDIYTSNQFASGLIGLAGHGYNWIQNCVVSVNIHSSHDGDGTHGGFIALLQGEYIQTCTTYFTGCAFTGSITTTNNTTDVGGFVGWCEYSLNDYNLGRCDIVFNDCFVNPNQECIPEGSKTYARCQSEANSLIINSSCYYTQTIGDAQGTQAYSITPGEYVTVANAGSVSNSYNASGLTFYNQGFKCGDVLYAVSGDEVSMTVGSRPGYTTSGYTASAGTLTGSGNTYTLTMPNENVTISATNCYANPLTTDGNGNYLINNEDDWAAFCANVNLGTNNFSSDTVKLMADISVSMMAGKSLSNSFQGTFEGNGHTITLSGGDFGTSSEPFDEEYCAPFRYVAGVTIQNLSVEGDIYTSNKFAGGLIGRIGMAGNGNNVIQNCIVSVNIHSSLNGDGSHGGFIAILRGGYYQECTATITGCAFTGSITTTNNTTDIGGFVGWCEYRDGNLCHLVFNDCFVDPSEECISEGGSKTYARCRSEENSLTINWSYYTVPIGDAQGMQVYNNAAEPIGSYTYYNVSGLKVYANGVIDSNDTFYNNPDVVFREITGYGDSTGSDHWAFISSPVRGSILPTQVGNLIGTQISDDPVLYNYDLYRLNPSTVRWENYHQHTADFNIVSGMGYLYATKETETLVFTGTFHMSGYKEITGLPAGFHLVGNPFPVEGWVHRDYYMLNEDGSAIVAKDPYEEDQSIPPCHGVIVQLNYGESVVFTGTSMTPRGPNNGSLQIDLTQANSRSNIVMDNVIVSFNEGSKLGKFYFGKQDANIYIPQGTEEYAIVYSNKQGEMPLNFKASKNGEYTLSINPKGVEMEYLHLIDNITGADVDLLAPDGGDAKHCVSTYTFTAKTTDYPSRFKLVFSICEDDNDDNGDNDDNENFAFFSNGNIIIPNASTDAVLQVVDATGRIIVSGDAKHCVSTSGMTPGVYVLRLMEGKDVKTQKIIVK